MLGVNSRLDALQVAILRVKLRHLDGWATARRRNAQRYRELFSELGAETIAMAPNSPSRTYHVYNQFTIRCKNRDALREHLADCGISTEVYYPKPLR
jgi:dTDP-4-amino-4,6-dideoxygalactose transaminase